MKPAAFDYVCVNSVAEAVAALAEAGADAKIIAGGQSLVPMLNFRLLQPSVLVDINRVDELSFLDEADGTIRIGALTRHHRLETDPMIARRLPVLHDAMAHVAHLAIRNRGSIGGSLSHADPAAELPMMAMLLDAELTIVGPSSTRSVAAQDFFRGALTTDLAEDELLTTIALRTLPDGTGWDVQEVARRAGDFAMAAVTATLTLRDGVIDEARIALMGVGETALRAHEAEALLHGEVVDGASVAAAVDAVRRAIDPPTDLHASGDYRRHLAGILTGRALANAWSRAGGATA